MEDRSDGRKAGYGLGENLPENGICVIHLSRTFKELLMKIVKATLIALAVAAASTAMAQDPSPSTVSLVDPAKWDVKNAKVFKEKQTVYDYNTRTQVQKTIMIVSEILPPAPIPKTAFMAVINYKKDEVVAVEKTTNGFVVQQDQPSAPVVAPWAWVPN